MPGPVAKTQPNPKDRPQQEGELQPEVSRQFDDAPVSDLVTPQPQAGKSPLPEGEAHPDPGTSKNINTGDSASKKSS